jgi:hypothetical protein
MKCSVAVWVATALFACGCSSNSINAYKAPSANMALYTSFNWAPASGKGVNLAQRKDNAKYVPEYLEKAIVSELEAKGYSRVDRPAVLIGYHVALDSKLDAATVAERYTYKYAKHYMFRPGASSWRPEPVNLHSGVASYSAGTLIVDFVDRKSNTLIWRGTVPSKLGASTSRTERDVRIQLAMKRLLGGL